MIVSIINNQPIYGVEHPDADEVFSISQEDFEKIKSGQAMLIGQEIVDIIVEKKEEDIMITEKYPLDKKIDILIIALSEISENEELIKLSDFIQNK